VVSRLVVVLLVMFAFEVYSEDEKEVVVRSTDQFNISNWLLSGTKRIENTMNAKQKYLFDLNGYLHLKDVLATDELSKAQAAIDRLLEMPSDKLPLGIARNNSAGAGNGDTAFSNGFSADKSLESLT